VRYYIDPNYSNIKIAAIPTGFATMAWVHFSTGAIERLDVKPERMHELEELTEEKAREHDPEIFSGCLDRPYYDAPTMHQFYIDKAMCWDVEPPVKQVGEYLIKECDMQMCGTISAALTCIEMGHALQFGIVAYGSKHVFYTGPELPKPTSDYARERIEHPATHLAWWRYNTLDKDIPAAVFIERLKGM
jgi:hypothetical protein